VFKNLKMQILVVLAAGAAREEVARRSRIGIDVPVLAELWCGIELSSTRDCHSQ
jgi:hypothetical protein